MKRSWLFAAAVGLLALVAWAVSYSWGIRQTKAFVRADQAELEWLREEFKLSASQFTEIKRLHQEYEPICAQLCERVMSSQSRLTDLIERSSSVTPEIESALAECATVKQCCQTAMLGHIYRVSHLMEPEQARRYLVLMQSRIVRPGTGLNRDLPAH